MKSKKSLTKGEAWFLLIAGVIMGTVFTFGMQYWHAPITQEEAIRSTAIYASYKEQIERGRVTEITLHFEDHEQMYIDGVCVSEDLRDSIHSLTPGTQLSLMAHPNSNTIMDLKAENHVLLDFNTTSEKLTGEATGFMGLGFFCYALSALGLTGLLFRKKR